MTTLTIHSVVLHGTQRTRTTEVLQGKTKFCNLSIKLTPQTKLVNISAKTLAPLIFSASVGYTLAGARRGGAQCEQVLHSAAEVQCA